MKGEPYPYSPRALFRCFSEPFLPNLSIVLSDKKSGLNEAKHNFRILFRCFSEPFLPDLNVVLSDEKSELIRAERTFPVLSRCFSEPFLPDSLKGQEFEFENLKRIPNVVV